MEPDRTLESGEPAPSTAKVYRLCAKEPGFRMKLSEATITVEDDRIVYQLDGAQTTRRFADLRSIRMQSMPGGAKGADWEAAIIFDFGVERTLTVSSASPWGYDDPKRDPTFITFVKDVHSRLAPVELRRIKFYRGADPSRHRMMLFGVALFAILFGGTGLFIVGAMFAGKADVFEALTAVVGIGGFGYWIYQMMEKHKPGTYDPKNLPADLYPE
jgi:hypothetical protein